MADREELLRLAERCEAATEGGRELDAEIWCAVRGYRFLKMESVNRLLYFPRSDADHHWGHQLMRREHVTTSLDAALTLVPDGCQEGRVRWECGEPWMAELIARSAVSGAGATAALALCAAALRARAAQAERG